MQVSTEMPSASNPIDQEPFVGVVPRDALPPSNIRRLHLILIKPSKYDDEGYVIRHFRGVLPSNTLAALTGLAEEVADSGALGAGIDLKIDSYDETVQKLNVKKIAAAAKQPGVRVLVALCAVQTNQFPRACDLARKFKAEGLNVMIGGFHVSGAIEMSLSGMPPECQEMLDAGVTLVKGEVEECWGDILRDALHDKLKLFYDVKDKPDLSHSNLPIVRPELLKRFAYKRLGTIDAGRGCPFNCSFCTIINVQGRKMRNRLAEKIRERVLGNLAYNVDYYFFTDDNFARNPNWREIFQSLIDLRKEGININFMMQIDTVAYKLKNFISMAKEAGCTQVFIGMETINPENIGPSGKVQNKVNDYKHMIDLWHEAGIACHVGYIIGFPYDSVESIREDVRRLVEEIGVDQASFFILTPLPGSRDHQDMVRAGEWMDSDYNKFDSFHVVQNHPRMTHDEWFDVYKAAWRSFYSRDHMVSILSRASDRSYWGLFKNFIWYKQSAIIEQNHPMITGFFRLKDRTDRRPGFQIDPLHVHLAKRVREVGKLMADWGKLFFEMQDVWLATRGRPKMEKKIQEWKSQASDFKSQVSSLGGNLEEARQRAKHLIANRVAGLKDEIEHAGAKAEEVISRHVDMIAAELQELGAKAEELREQLKADALAQFERLRESHNAGMTRLRRRISEFNLLSTARIHTRAHLDRYWVTTYERLKQGAYFKINPFKLGWNFLRDVKISTCFIYHLLFSDRAST